MTSPIEYLCERVGARLVRIRRQFYVFGADVENRGGRVELSFDDGSVMQLAADPGPDTLRATPGAWVDPMVPLTDEIVDFLARSLRPIVVDVSTTLGLHLEGEEVLGIETEGGQGTVKELTILTSRNRFTFVLGADQVYEVRAEHLFRHRRSAELHDDPRVTPRITI